MKRLKKYVPFFKASMMDLMAFRASIITWLIVTFFQVLCTIFLWIAVYHNALDTMINGFTMNDMIVYQVFINIFVFVTFDGTTSYTINQEIKDGTIAMSFVKPISYRVRFIFNNLGSFVMLALIFGLPCFTIAYTVFYFLGFIVIKSFWVFLGQLGLFLVAQVIATMLNDVINYIFGVLCFYTTASFGLNQIQSVVVSFLSGTFIPLAFFPDSLKGIVNYLPFAGMGQNPVLILLGMYDFPKSLMSIGLSLGWLLILEGFAFLLFNHASKKVTVQGG